MPELPTVTFDPTKKVVGRHSIIVFTPTGASAVELLVDYIGHAAAVEVGTAQGIGTDGVAFTAKSWPISSSDVFRFRCREIKKLITAFGSLAFFKSGACVIYVRDPTDAAGKVALLSESFAASLYRDPAEAEFAPANPAEITLIIQALTDEPVELTLDVTA